MTKIGFFVANEKGFNTIKSFIEKKGSSNISFISSYRNDKVKKDFYSEINKIAANNGISFLEKNDPEIKKIETDIDIAIGWQWIVNNRKKLIVIHDSLLPKYRGFAPLVNMLINGESKIGITALHASIEYDKGDIVLQKHLEITYPIKIQEAITQISALYISAVYDIFEYLEKHSKLESTSQKEEFASYSPWLDYEDYFIDWKQDAIKIKRFIDAVGYPYDGAKTILKDEVLKIIDADVLDDISVEDRNRHIGKVIFLTDGYPVVICGKNLLKINSITNEADQSKFISLRSRFK